VSYDLAVWYPHRHLSGKQAQELYGRLCGSDISGIIAHPAIDTFYQELTAKHPEIDDVPEDQIDDLDLCPWSIAFDRSPGHIILCCVWSRAEYVDALVKQLARRHGLVVYDPQSGKTFHPAPSPASSPKPWWSFLSR
jgi:hypothetical protein